MGSVGDVIAEYRLVNDRLSLMNRVVRKAEAASNRSLTFGSTHSQDKGFAVIYI